MHSSRQETLISWENNYNFKRDGSCMFLSTLFLIGANGSACLRVLSAVVSESDSFFLYELLD